jgi:hypothetical protein
MSRTQVYPVMDTVACMVEFELVSQMPQNGAKSILLLEVPVCALTSMVVGVTVVIWVHVVDESRASAQYTSTEPSTGGLQCCKDRARLRPRWPRRFTLILCVSITV